jgi:hypothetical protein
MERVRYSCWRNTLTSDFASDRPSTMSEKIYYAHSGQQPDLSDWQRRDEVRQRELPVPIAFPTFRRQISVWNWFAAKQVCCTRILLSFQQTATASFGDTNSQNPQANPRILHSKTLFPMKPRSIRQHYAYNCEEHDS